MKLFWNRFKIMFKRTVKQPIYIVMLLFLLCLSVFYVMVPSEKKSLYITAAVLCEDTSDEASLFLDDLINGNSVFSFYVVNDLEELKKDVISGKANSGFVIPKNYIHGFIQSGYEDVITEYVTAGSFLPKVAFEEVYEKLFKYTSYGLLEKYLFDLNEDFANHKVMIKDVYDNYDVTDRLFNADREYKEYNDLTKDSKMELPIRKIAGLFIFIAAILGTAAYITDRENNIYLLMGNFERVSMRYVHILASVLPLGITTYFVMLILKEMSPIKSAVHVFVYMLVVACISLILGLLFKRSRSFYKFIPVLLVFTMVLSGVFFDIGKYNVFMNFLARLCPPYYF